MSEAVSRELYIALRRNLSDRIAVAVKDHDAAAAVKGDIDIIVIIDVDAVRTCAAGKVIK